MHDSIHMAKNIANAYGRRITKELLPTTACSLTLTRTAVITCVLGTRKFRMAMRSRATCEISVTFNDGGRARYDGI